MTVDPALDLPAVEYAQRSDPGRDPSKQVNEDACGHRQTRLGHLCVVCDGMGGHASGREAAELALATIFEVFEQAPEGAYPYAVLRAAVEEASRRVYGMPTTEAGGRPGSTVVAVLLHANGTEVAHVGDSRVYLVHEGQIARVTRDHSIVQEMVDRGLLTLEQAAQHPDANRITRALGMAPEVEVEVRPSPVPHLAGDAFVLCSDGLSDLVEDREILDTVGNVPAGQAVGKLVDLANARGGHDNITVLVLRARSSAFDAGGGGVAPTIAQTSVPQASDAGASQTVVDERLARGAGGGERATEAMPAHAAPLAAPAPHPSSLAPQPPHAGAHVDRAFVPPAFAPSAPRPAVTPGLVVAIAGSAIGIILALGFVAIRFADRMHGASGAGAVTGAASAGASNIADGAAPSPAASDGSVEASVAPTPLVAGTIDVAAAAVPSAEPLAPLAPVEPAPDSHRPPRKRKKQ